MTAVVEMYDLVNEVVCLERWVVGECVECLISFVLQVMVKDIWVWKLHSFHCYAVGIAYNNLIAVEDNIYLTNTKVVPLKISIFVRRLILNRVSTKG